MSDGARGNDLLGRLDEAIRRNPQNADLYVLKAQELLAQGRVEDALVELDVAIALARGRSFLASQTRGEARLRRRDFGGAIEDFRRALELEPDHPAALRQRGLCHFHLRQYAQAMQDLDRCLRVLPTDNKTERARVLTDRAAVLAALQDWEPALRDLAEATALDNRLGEPHAARGEIFLQLQDYGKAIAAFTAGLKCEERLEWLYRRAVAGYESGELEAAISDCDLVIARTKEQPHEAAHALRARACAELGRRGDAAATGKQSKTNEPAHDPAEGLTSLYARIKLHFAPLPLSKLFISQRVFPVPVRGDLQIALDAWLREATVHHFCGRTYGSLAELLSRRSPFGTEPQPPQFDDLDFGEPQPVRCLRSGLWLLEANSTRLLLLLNCDNGRVTFQIAAADADQGRHAAAAFFAHLRDTVQCSPTLRGKVISLGGGDRYAGETSPITVHDVPQVAREQLVLPTETLELLDRNVREFLRHRSELATRGLPSRKRLLFYGPPGTGKTHAVHYVIGLVRGEDSPRYTTLLVPPTQIKYFPDYLELAALLEPSLVVVENIELLGNDLSEVLHEVQQVPPDAEVMLLLTASQREAASRALSGGADRVDQAIEFKLPEDDCRARLVRLFAGSIRLTDDLVQEVVALSDNMSPALLKELLRRAVQFQLARDPVGPLRWEDVRAASDELLLNEELLGGRPDFGFQRR